MDITDGTLLLVGMKVRCIAGWRLKTQGAGGWWFPAEGKLFSPTWMCVSSLWGKLEHSRLCPWQLSLRRGSSRADSANRAPLPSSDRASLRWFAPPFWWWVEAFVNIQTPSHFFHYGISVMFACVGLYAALSLGTECPKYWMWDKVIRWLQWESSIKKWKWAR